MSVRKGISRRQVLGAGAAVTATGISAALAPEAWAFVVGKNGAIVVEEGDAGDWQPLFFDARQVAQVVALCEQLLPGSTEARVHEFLDLELSLDSETRQVRFGEGLRLFDDLCKKAGGKRLHKASAEQIVLVLRTVSDDREDRGAGFAEKFFDDLKRRTIFAFYTSLEGRRALGLGDKITKQVYIGCEHKGGHG